VTSRNVGKTKRKNNKICYLIRRGKNEKEKNYTTM
jgi:hypothetical protein